MNEHELGAKLIETLSKKLLQYDDAASICALYHVTNNFKKALEDIMKSCRNWVDNHIQTTGEVKGRVPTGTWGLTQPKPKTVLNEAAWNQAIENDHDLYSLVETYRWNELRYKEAQKAYMHEVTPKGRVYIK